jgi:small nuclear ribonucleoprotein
LEAKMDPTRPIDALNNARNKKVIIELKNGRQYVGVLKAFDIHINCVLDNAEERENGEVKRKVGSLFIRGDTITIILTD